MNVVVVISGGMTETLQAAPLIATLAVATGSPVVVACPPTAGDMARDLAGVVEVITVPALGNRGRPLGLARLWRQLRRRRVDIAMLCTDAAVVRTAVYVSGVPCRIGCAGGVSERLLSDSVPCRPGENRTLAWLGLLSPLGMDPIPAAAHFSPGAASSAVAEQLLLSHGVGDGRLLVAIAPANGFSDEPVTAWAPERYAHLANRLASRHGAGVILLGDAGDRAAVDAMCLDLAAETVDLCGELNLATTAAVLARCDLLIAADTPLLHLSAAVDTPSVGLFGPTDGRRRAPAGREHRVVQALPDEHGAATLARIRVDDVLAGIESAL